MAGSLERTLDSSSAASHPPQFLAIFRTGCLGIATVYGKFCTREYANESANGYGREYASAYTNTFEKKIPARLDGQTVAAGTRLPACLGGKKVVAAGTQLQIPASIPSVF